MFPRQRHHFFRQQFQRTIELRQAEQIGYAQQDHEQGIIKAADDLLVGYPAHPPQNQGKAYC